MPCYIHTIGRLYDSSIRTRMADGSTPLAVPEPYTAGRFLAAWSVLTGKAYAFAWPKPGELETALKLHWGDDREQPR